MDGTSGSLRRPQRAPSPSLPGEDAARWAVSQQVGPHPASLPAPCPGRPPAGTTRNELPLLTSRRVCPSGTEGRGRLPAAKPTGRTEHACAQAHLPEARTVPRALSPSPRGRPPITAAGPCPSRRAAFSWKPSAVPRARGPAESSVPQGGTGSGVNTSFLRQLGFIFSYFLFPASNIGSPFQKLYFS